MTPTIGVIADDLTGAMDTGLQFAKCGPQTLVFVERLATEHRADVLVIDTESRTVSPETSAHLVAEAAAALKTAGCSQFYKKLDSTLRGNVGAEIEGALAGLGAEVAVVCPSFVGAGRTVRAGTLFVRNVPLDQSEFQSDPLWPATTASVAAILGRQSNQKIGAVTLATIRQGPTAIESAIEAHVVDSVRLVVADAVNSRDLQSLAAALDRHRGRWLAAGSAGLAEWLHVDSPIQRPVYPPTAADGPVLVVNGSASETARSQLSTLLRMRNARAVSLSVTRSVSEPQAVVEKAAESIVQHLRAHRWAILSFEPPEATVGDLIAAAEEIGLPIDQLAARLMAVLSETVAKTTSELAIGGMILTGGDTALAVGRAIGVEAVRVEREIAPGIPQGRFLGGRLAGRPVVTKAGGFGQSDALVLALECLIGEVKGQ